MMLFQNILLHSVKLYVQTGSQGFGHDRQLDMLSLILTTYIGFLATPASDTILMPRASFENGCFALLTIRVEP